MMSNRAEYRDERAGTFTFGQYKCKQTQCFFRSKLSLGFVNLKPVVPGHVLIIPKKRILRYSDLSPSEIADLWQSAQTIGKKIEAHYKATSLTYVIQDGPDAGQTVSHVHVHILPRRPGDFKPNDKVYDALVDNDTRVPRTEDEMMTEAFELSQLFPEYQTEAIEAAEN
eukprot:TRINITY_DN5340_c0_g1_i1.p1 TRINITY_DN5340_c0_g1~~TRINITY_DN5340_c0_g1_i1.p1  ORF type:complete len:169 (-),score=28.67 TRINITY_DN5340_c0_g1_i1:14-520(-)